MNLSKRIIYLVINRSQRLGLSLITRTVRSLLLIEYPITARVLRPLTVGSDLDWLHLTKMT